MCQHELRLYGFSSNTDNTWHITDQSKTSATEGDGGIYASAQALIAWQRSLYKENIILTPKSLAWMTEPYTKTDLENEFYGFGIFINQTENYHYYQHNGSSIGFRNALFYLPKQDISLVILSNLNGPKMVEIGQDMLTAMPFLRHPGDPRGSA